ncbi:MAG: ATP-binding domain-containing protein [Elusimicrobia bacterium]|nr:ATP-binding domain-containing protein [Elusimicrobiota bacterium]
MPNISRSQAGIVEAAGQVIRKNPSRLPRELLARLEKGLPIEITSYSTDRQEAQMIAQKIENLLGGTNRLAIESRADVTAPQESLYGLEDIVILYRLHTQARLVAEALGRAGLPFQVFQKIKDEAPSAAEDLEDFQNNETGFIRGKKITLMTLHRAKGLEFPVVFIIGCEGGIVPCDILKNASDIEEERRLFYVGMTRAKERLIISCAKKRFIFGKTLKAGPSPFLSDIEEKLRVLGRGPSFKKRQPQIKQPTLFKL